MHVQSSKVSIFAGPILFGFKLQIWYSVWVQAEFGFQFKKSVIMDFGCENFGFAHLWESKIFTLDIILLHDNPFSSERDIWLTNQELYNMSFNFSEPFYSFN